MDVAVTNRQRTIPFISEEVANLVKEVVSYEGHSCREVGVHFIGTAAMRRLHSQYFNDSSLTDCISFPLDDEFLGDVFVCPQVALRYARKRGEDPYREAILYLIHGLLHLMGYDDINEKDRKKMRAAEERHLAHLQRLRYI